MCNKISKICCFSVAKSCPTLCNPMDCSTAGFLCRMKLKQFLTSGNKSAHEKYKRQEMKFFTESPISYSHCPLPFLPFFKPNLSSQLARSLVWVPLKGISLFGIESPRGDSFFSLALPTIQAFTHFPLSSVEQGLKELKWSQIVSKCILKS